jgi:hypothetical protein
LFCSARWAGSEYMPESVIFEYDKCAPSNYLSKTMPGLAVALWVLEKRSKNRNFYKSWNGHSYHVEIGTSIFSGKTDFGPPQVGGSILWRILNFSATDLKIGLDYEFDIKNDIWNIADSEKCGSYRNSLLRQIYIYKVGEKIQLINCIILW